MWESVREERGWVVELVLRGADSDAQRIVWSPENTIMGLLDSPCQLPHSLSHFIQPRKKRRKRGGGMTRGNNGRQQQEQPC